MSTDFNSKEIREALVKHHNRQELRNLCDDLHIPFEELQIGSPETLSGIAREMIGWLSRRDRLSDLEPYLHGVKVVYGAGAPKSPPDAQPRKDVGAGYAPTANDDSASPPAPKVVESGGNKVTENSSTVSRSRVQLILTFLLGAVLTCLLIWVFLYAPNTLPTFKQRMLAIACALVAGLFAFLLTGSIGLDSKSLKTPLGELALTATGGIGVFVLVLIWWLSPITPISTETVGPTPTPSPTIESPVSKQNVIPLVPLLTQSRINKVALSRDGELLASAEESGAVRVWRVKSGSPPKELFKSGKSSPARCVAIGPNDQTIGAGSADGKVRIWRTSDDSAPVVIASHTNAVYELYFSPDGQRLVLTGADSGNVRVVRLWKLSGKPEILKSFRLPNLDDQILTISADLLTLMIYRPYNKRVELWSLPDSKLQTSLEDSNLEAKAGAFSHDGQTLAIGSDTGTVGVWRAKDGKRLNNLKGTSERVVSIAVTPDGQIISAGYPDGSVSLWSSNEVETIFNAREHTQRVFSLVFSASGRVLASGGEDGKIQLWEIGSKG